MITDIKNLIKNPKSEVFRKAYIKRRSITTGLFEDDWLDISSDVKSYGKIINQIDVSRRNKFTFGNAKLVMSNEDGKYSSHETPSSLWYGYLNQQRTLVKLEAGFIIRQIDDNGVYTNIEFPPKAIASSLWDLTGAVWDVSYWDSTESIVDTSVSSMIFTGLISGDIPLADKNEITLNLRPLISVFQDFPAKALTGWTSTGFTASQFIENLRDQTDGAGGFVFRHFFGNTITNWDISATTNVFTNLNTSTAADVIDSTVWGIVEKLAEAENFVPYVTRAGIFKFVSRSSIANTDVYQFHGAGSPNSEYGCTIKTVSAFGFKVSEYYSRVQMKWNAASTSTSYEIVESTFTVSGISNPWILGNRTLSIENIFIQTSTVANALAQSIFDDVASIKKSITFSTTFVPHLDIFDRISIYYDPATFYDNNLWDANNWPADSTDTSSDLILENGAGDALVLSGEQFKIVSFEIDLDNFQNSFIAREV